MEFGAFGHATIRNFPAINSVNFEFRKYMSSLPAHNQAVRVIQDVMGVERRDERTRLRVALDEVNTLLDVLLQVNESSLEELLFVGGDVADGEDLLGTVGAELNPGGEEVDALVFVERALDESGLDDALLTLGSLEEGLGETGTSEGHGEGGGTSAILGLDDLVTTKLNTVDELVTGSAVEVGVVGLGEEGNDGDTRVTTDNGDDLVGGVGVLELGDEARSTDDVKSGDTEETLGVVDTLGLVDLGDDGDGRVDLSTLANAIALPKGGGEYIQGWR